VIGAYGLPHATDEEKAKRAASIQAALKDATLAPLRAVKNADCTSFLGVRIASLAAMASGRPGANKGDDATLRPDRRTSGKSQGHEPCRRFHATID
jgi:hypothetical protein